MLLAIDTATRAASLALYDGNGIIGELTWVTHESHTTTLLPEIDRLLALTGRSFDSLAAFAVSLGPGSFTSLRVGISATKGLAVTRHLPVIGIPTLDCVAFAQRDAGEKIGATISAGRGRFAIALYTSAPKGVERVSDIFLGKPDELIRWARAFGSGIYFCGEVTGELAALIERSLQNARVASAGVRLRRAGYLAEMAWTRFLRGEIDTLETLAPFYLPTASVPVPLTQ